MKWFRKAKDGGPKSTVTGYWLLEAKKLCSVVLLKFEHGSREAYHSHAFNSINWVLSGKLLERVITVKPGGGFSCNFTDVIEYRPSWRPIVTRRNRFHKVESSGTTWVFSLRGPWADSWQELTAGGRVELKHGRVEK